MSTGNVPIRFNLFSRQRKLRNYLLRPSLQVQLAAYTICLTFFFASILVAIVAYHFAGLYEIVLSLTDLESEIGSLMHEYLQGVAGYLVVLLLLYMIFVVVLTVVATHALIGPTIAFQRHIKAMIAGDFNSRIKLRKYDAFQEVATDLNQLAESFAQRMRK